MKLEDFEARVPTAEDGRRLQFLWSRYIFSEAQKAAWMLWIKVGTSIILAFGAVVTVWTGLQHGVGK